MPRKRRMTAKTRIETEVKPAIWAWLNDEPITKDDSETLFEIMVLEGGAGGDGHKLRELWDRVRVDLLARWTADKPGTRPSIWWRFDAPRQPLGTFAGCYYDGMLPEPRKLLGGKGWPAFEKLSYVPEYDHGIPARWYDVHSDDLPTFEAEATYLKRYGFLTASEKRALKKSDFEPVMVEYVDDYYRQQDTANGVAVVG